MSNTTSAAPATNTTISDGVGSAQSKEGISVVTLLTAIATAFAIFAVQIGVFELIRNKFARIYIPKTYLVPEREKTRAPPRKLLFWMKSIFEYRDKEVIRKCGLDGYFFLRYLQTLLIIFIPLACLLLPILLPLNYIGGRGSSFSSLLNSTTGENVTGLDTVAWGNVSPSKTNRYWVHLFMAIIVVVWVCYVFFAELLVYIRVRQDYLTSPEHRLKASATTVMVSSIPNKWLTEKALMGLYDVFPGGIRNIWINRNYDKLMNKVHLREKLRAHLELAETKLIVKCKKAQMKQANKDEARMVKKTGAKQPTKKEKHQRKKAADGEADRVAHSEGQSSGDPHQIRRTVDEAVDDEESTVSESKPDRVRFNVPVLGAVGQGLGRGFGRFGDQIGRAGQTIVGGALSVGRGIDDQLGTTNGFVPIDSPVSPQEPHERYKLPTRRPTDPQGAITELERENRHVIHPSLNNSHLVPQNGIGSSKAYTSSHLDHSAHNRTTSQVSLDRIATRFGPDGSKQVDSSDNWLKFWKGPAVGYASPMPDGFEADEFPLDQKIPQIDGSPMPRDITTDGSVIKRRQRPTTMDHIKRHIQRCFSSEDENEGEYPLAFNLEYKEEVEGGAMWEKYIKRSERPTHKIGQLSSVPFFGKKVDSIYWCREQLARLNVEIEEDQRHPERYPLMNSAFIQFNHQVAAHMASQCISHHVPKSMAPRVVEVSPTDVIWENMSIKWWESWIRTVLVLGVVTAMTILWAIPVSGTALLGNLPALIDRLPWLSFLNNNGVVKNVFLALGGVLPALALAILLALVPVILYLLATLQGAQTGMIRELSVQNYLFFFDFIQIFLVVSIASGAFTTLAATASDVTSIPRILALQLPKAANYFFSYLILQAMGNSSGALLQYLTLILWFVLPKFLDNTARQKWTRNTSLSVVSWGSYFPLYTTFACIALVYSVVAPLILIFAILTFALYWVANRYCMLYIFKTNQDTGGLLYPRAINQTYLGLYVMEVCMIGLFFLVRDENDTATCTPQAVIMIVVTGLTVVYQVLLNQAFGPLFRYLPITLEDEAVLRDEAFARAQAVKWGDVVEELDEDETSADNERYNRFSDARETDDIELKKISKSNTGPEERSFSRFDPRKGIADAAGWATRRTAAIKTATFGRAASRNPNGILQQRRHRNRDLEAQKKIGNALFGGIEDEIEDLSPDERDALVNHAFKHSALRSRRPVVWIPKDDLGVSDEEVQRTQAFTDNIWISNDGTALDGKARVVYGKNPPDFSYVDLIKL